MKRKIIKTADGSSTIHLEEWNEQYHSKHGAVQEAKHVFIKHGLHAVATKNNPLRILEIGFGTGLNAIITCLDIQDKNLQIAYTGIEKFPVALDEIQQLDYSQVVAETKDQEIFQKMHDVSWETWHNITPNFSLKKQQLDFLEITENAAFDLVYFDAFGARVQPELWTEVLFQKMYDALSEGGTLVTYAAKGSVRRAMQHVGFTVERLPGPPGKREMLRATKELIP